eukprot:gene22669-biopygen13301
MLWPGYSITRVALPRRLNFIAQLGDLLDGCNARGVLWSGHAFTHAARVACACVPTSTPTRAVWRGGFPLASKGMRFKKTGKHDISVLCSCVATLGIRRSDRVGSGRGGTEVVVHVRIEPGFPDLKTNKSISPQLLPAPAVRRSCPERHYESTACMLNNGRTRTVADVPRRVSTPGETCAAFCCALKRFYIYNVFLGKKNCGIDSPK